MFSVILYGRNDSHGYNLHKRAAISFNALAEVMSDLTTRSCSWTTTRRTIIRPFPRRSTTR